MDTITEAYQMGKKHFAETIWSVPSLAFFIEQRGFTCNELQELIRSIEDIKGSDFGESESSIDMFDRVEAQNGQY